MSTWGAWGYLGIVTGLLALLTVFFSCMEIIYRIPKAKGENQPLLEPKEQPSAGTRRAA